MSELKHIDTYLNIRNSRNRWRFALIVLFFFFAVPSFVSFMKKAPFESQGDIVAKVAISGMILSDDDAIATLKDLAKDKQVKAVIVTVDSPGGTMVGGLQFYNALKKLSQTKPVVTVMETVAASAGYLVSLAGEHMLANEATLTGSIGVFMPLVDATKLAERVGIISDDIVSGNLKAVTSPLAQRDAKSRQYLQDMVNRLNGVFYKYVTLHRPNLSEHTLTKIKDGRALVGVEAMEMNLVDALGGVDEARQWLQQEKEIPLTLELVDVDLNTPDSLLETVFSSTFIGQEWHAFMKPSVWALIK